MINGKVGQRFLWKPKNGWAFPYFEIIEILSNDNNNCFKCKVLYSIVPKELAHSDRFYIEAYWFVNDRNVDDYTLLSNQNKCEIL